MKTEVDQPQVLLHYLRDRIANDYSTRLIKRAIENKGCLVNGRLERFASRKLRQGDRIHFDLKRGVGSKTTSQSLKILYQSNAIVAFEKPVDWVCTQESIPGLYLVHRLDKETSGVWICAKNKEVQAHLEQQFKQREIEKKYHAIVKGQTENQGKCEGFLAAKVRFCGGTIYGSADRGQWASTQWQCLKKNTRASLLELKPKTGRTHQLRVHLSELGHPILGDAVYGRGAFTDYRPQRHLLHASEIVFFDPSENKKVAVHSPLPDDFKTALEFLKLDQCA